MASQTLGNEKNQLIFPGMIHSIWHISYPRKKLGMEMSSENSLGNSSNFKDTLKTGFLSWRELSSRNSTRMKAIRFRYLTSGEISLQHYYAAELGISVCLSPRSGQSLDHAGRRRSETYPFIRLVGTRKTVI